jgi:TetR/AcrR family transcriptional repressor of nem operon
MSAIDTRQAIMTAARAVVQAHGYNGLSFRELAKEVGIKSASIHYHFPTKGDLGAALARAYTEEAIAYFDNLPVAAKDRDGSIRKYTDVFRGALLKNNRMCLCGIMAAEHDDLPAEVRAEVDRFTDVNVAFLVKLLSSGKSGSPGKAVQRRALAIFGAIEGAQLVARGRGDVAVFDEIVDAYRAAGLFQ